jgi:hypothetical protein
MKDGVICLELLLPQLCFNFAVSYILTLKQYVSCRHMCTHWPSAVLPFLPESPRQLVVKGRTEQATAALTKIYGKSVPETFIQSELSQIEQSIEIAKAGTYRELFKSYNRKPLIICK